MATLSFQDSSGQPAGAISDIAMITYEDKTNNIYTLDFSTIDTPALKFQPQSGNFTDLISSLCALSATLDTIDANVSTVKTNVGVIKANVNKIDTNIETIGATLGTLEDLNNNSLGKQIYDYAEGYKDSLASTLNAVFRSTSLIPPDFDDEFKKAYGSVQRIHEGTDNLLSVSAEVKDAIGEIDTKGRDASLADMLKAVQKKTDLIPTNSKLATDDGLQKVKETVYNNATSVTRAVDYKLGSLRSDILDKLATGDSVKQLTDAIEKGSISGSKLKTELENLNKTLKEFEGCTPYPVIISSALVSDISEINNTDIVQDFWTNNI